MGTEEEKIPMVYPEASIEGGCPVSHDPTDVGKWRRGDNLYRQVHCQLLLSCWLGFSRIQTEEEESRDVHGDGI